MKTRLIFTALALIGSLSSAFAQLTIPSDGTDGAFNPAANVEIDLSLATAGDGVTVKWDSPNGGNAGKGIYDPVKWAVVFKYSSINIPAGVTVTFKNHPSHAPVVWLVQGSVTIAGNVNLNGQPSVSGPNSVFPTEPGPGGFRGGASGPSGAGVGLGLGGSSNYNSPTGLYASVYGNPQILPLIGGSGGFATGPSGGGGGGAILLAAPGAVSLTGTITTLGGSNGGGGGIKLIANQITGTGSINSGYDGRLRVEANSLSGTIATSPSTIAVTPGTTPTIFQSSGSPTVKVVSVDGAAAPADPTAPLVSAADIAIQKNTPVIVVLETRNFATAGAVVSVRITYKYGAAGFVNATLDAGGTSTLSTWRANFTVPPGFVTFQARATAP